MRRSAVGSRRRTAAASATRTSCTGPAGIAARGELRHQYAHAIDIVPTVLDALGISTAVASNGSPTSGPRSRRRAKPTCTTPGTQVVPGNAAVNVVNRSHTITADVEIPDAGAEGVLFAHGGIEGGYTFFLQDGHLHNVYNLPGAGLDARDIQRARATRPCDAALRVRTHR